MGVKSTRQVSQSLQKFCEIVENVNWSCDFRFFYMEWNLWKHQSFITRLCTMWKSQNFTPTILWQKFRQINLFVKEIYSEFILQEKFLHGNELRFFNTLRVLSAYTIIWRIFSLIFKRIKMESFFVKLNSITKQNGKRNILWKQLDRRELVSRNFWDNCIFYQYLLQARVIWRIFHIYSFYFDFITYE